MSCFVSRRISILFRWAVFAWLQGQSLTCTSWALSRITQRSPQSSSFLVFSPSLASHSHSSGCTGSRRFFNALYSPTRSRPKTWWLSHHQSRRVWQALPRIPRRTGVTDLSRAAWSTMRWQALWRRRLCAEQPRQEDKIRTTGNLITVIHTRTLARLSGGCPKKIWRKIEDFLRDSFSTWVEDVLRKFEGKKSFEDFFVRFFSNMSGGCPKEDLKKKKLGIFLWDSFPTWVEEDLS